MVRVIEPQDLGVQKLTWSGLNGVSERDFRKTNLPFSRLVKILHLRGENSLQNTHFYKQKGALFKNPFKLDRVSFSTERQDRGAKEKKLSRGNFYPASNRCLTGQGKTPWVDSACADCPVLGSAPAPASTFSRSLSLCSCQEDVNGEKLTVKKWWIFGADFFTVWCRFFHGLRRFFSL